MSRIILYNIYHYFRAKQFISYYNLFKTGLALFISLLRVAAAAAAQCHQDLLMRESSIQPLLFENSLKEETKVPRRFNMKSHNSF